jgi:hypothetical protein
MPVHAVSAIFPYHLRPFVQTRTLITSASNAQRRMQRQKSRNQGTAPQDDVNTDSTSFVLIFQDANSPSPRVKYDDLLIERRLNDLINFERIRNYARYHPTLFANSGGFGRAGDMSFLPICSNTG